MADHQKRRRNIDFPDGNGASRLEGMFDDDSRRAGETIG